MAVLLTVPLTAWFTIAVSFVLLYAYYTGPLQGYTFIGVLVLLACVSLPPMIGVSSHLNGGAYSFKDYSLQVFFPVILGLIGLLFTLPYLFDANSIEAGIIILSSASILFSLLSFAYFVQRIRFNGI